MLSIVLSILTFALVLVSLFLILVVLSQKAKSDGGVGAAMGGGMAEAAFGAETNTVLTKLTIYSTILFFLLSLGLYLGRLYERRPGSGSGALPTIEVTPLSTPLVDPMTTAPATEPAAAPSVGAPTAPGSAPAPAN
jgi:preprotein translocase subunit SecG